MDCFITCGLESACTGRACVIQVYTLIMFVIFDS